MLVTAAVLLILTSPILGLKRGQLLDMSYSFGPTTLYWPGNKPFKLDILSRGPSGSIPWNEGNAFSGAEHGGTHMDAPAHFSQGKHRIDDIPIDKLVGPAVRIDISEKAKANRNYTMTAQDLQDWEKDYGKVPDGSILFVYTGWGAFYPDRLAYFGSERNDTYLDTEGQSLFYFPGVAPEAATWLVENRKISGVGIDTPSIDYGQSTDFMAHQILLAVNIYGLENVANLDKLPNVGTKVQAFPMKIEDGSGAPVRIVAVLDETCGTAAKSAVVSVFGCLCVAFVLLI